MHYLGTCDAVMRVPPSKINSKAIVEEGVDHLSFVGHSARVCCPCRCKYHHHEEGFDCKRRSRWGHEYEATRDFADFCRVRAVLELPWLEVTVFCTFRDRLLHPFVTVFWSTNTKTLPLIIVLLQSYLFSLDSQREVTTSVMAMVVAATQLNVLMDVLRSNVSLSWWGLTLTSSTYHFGAMRVGFCYLWLELYGGSVIVSAKNGSEVSRAFYFILRCD